MSVYLDLLLHSPVLPINFEIKNWKFLLNLILDWIWILVIITTNFCYNFKIYKFIYFLMIFIILIHWSHFWRVMFWTRKVSFWDKTYMHSLKNRIFVWKSFKNLYCTNVSKLKLESIQIWMNKISKSFYLRNMFEFVHHPKYGCLSYYRLTTPKILWLCY
jgi:hypothetical protein